MGQILANLARRPAKRRHDWHVLRGRFRRFLAGKSAVPAGNWAGAPASRSFAAATGRAKSPWCARLAEWGAVGIDVAGFKKNAAREASIAPTPCMQDGGGPARRRAANTPGLASAGAPIAGFSGCPIDLLLTPAPPRFTEAMTKDTFRVVTLAAPMGHFTFAITTNRKPCKRCTLKSASTIAAPTWRWRGQPVFPRIDWSHARGKERGSLRVSRRFLRL